MFAYKTKLIVTPYFVEKVVSSSPVLRDYTDNSSTSFKTSHSATILNATRHDFALTRARRNLRLALASNISLNHDLAFWSFTFNPEYDSIAKSEPLAREYFHKFMKRLKRHAKLDIKYLAIAELQKKNGRKAWHFHVLFFNVSYYPHADMQNQWNAGFVFVTSRRTEIKSIQHLIIYMSKYLTKDTDVGRSKKLFWTSRGLQKPQVLFDSSFDFSNWTLYSSVEVTFLDKPQYFIQTYYNNHAIFHNPKPVTHRVYRMDR